MHVDDSAVRPIVRSEHEYCFCYCLFSVHLSSIAGMAFRYRSLLLSFLGWDATTARECAFSICLGMRVLIKSCFFFGLCDGAICGCSCAYQEQDWEGNRWNRDFWERRRYGSGFLLYTFGHAVPVAVRRLAVYRKASNSSILPYYFNLTISDPCHVLSNVTN